jgi:site-specific recombinase XerD
MEIIRRLTKERPHGPIFLNNRGNPWTGFAVKIRFERLEKKIGKRIKHYDLRRTYITDKIVAGVDSHVVAKLAGHVNTAMIDRHYSVVADNYEFMLRQAQTTAASAGQKKDDASAGKNSRKRKRKDTPAPDRQKTE